MTNLKVNGQVRVVGADADTPLLWVLRDELGLTGTKFGCGIAACGACTVHLDGVADALVRLARRRRSRQPTVVTIEGLAGAGRERRIRCSRPGSTEQVPQCGYCQSGMIMAAVGAAGEERRSRPMREIDAAMTATSAAAAPIRGSPRDPRRERVGRRRRQGDETRTRPF